MAEPDTHVAHLEVRKREKVRERDLDDNMGKGTGRTLSFLSLLSFTVQLPQKFLFLEDKCDNSYLQGSFSESLVLGEKPPVV